MVRAELGQEPTFGWNRLFACGREVCVVAISPFAGENAGPTLRRGCRAQVTGIAPSDGAGLNGVRPLSTGARGTMMGYFWFEHFTQMSFADAYVDPHKMTYRACQEARAHILEAIVWRIVVFCGSGRHARRLSGINLMIVRSQRSL